MSEVITRPLAYWQSGGPLVVPIAAACFGIWFYFWRTRGRLRRVMASIDAILHELAPLFHRHGRLAGVREELGRRRQQLARIVATVLGDIQTGARVGESFDAHLRPVLVTAQQDLAILRALTVIAPLLGLLGTVLGMMDTFRAVGNAGVSERMAAGISRALITTQFGLVVAIPGLFGVARLSRLIRRVQANMVLCRTRLSIEIEQLKHR